MFLWWLLLYTEFWSTYQTRPVRSWWAFRNAFNAQLVVDLLWTCYWFVTDPQLIEPVQFEHYAFVGLPGVRFLTGQSGFLAICPVRNMMANRTISCPVFSQP